MSACFAAFRCSCNSCSSIIFSPNTGSTCRRSWRRSAALALSSAAYQAEILRGALNAVPRGQGEAATALGFSGLDIWRRILLPQALRISTPPLINEFILLIKASSLVSVVGIAELTRVSMNIASQTYRPLEAYVGGGLFYLAINLCLAGLGALAERRLAAAGAR